MSATSSRPSRSAAHSRLRSHNSPLVNGNAKDVQEAAAATTSESPTPTRSSKRVIRLTTRTRGEEGSAAEVSNKKQKKEESVADDEEAREKDAKEETKLYERWAEEYYEIVEQLPLELHRTFTLMRELESKMHDSVAATASHAEAYRNVRMEMGPRRQGKAQQDIQSHALEHIEYGSSSDRDAEGEDDEEVFHEADVVAVEEALQREKASLPVGGFAAKAERLSLLQNVAVASSQAIRAAEEKVGLAVTVYDWVDRQIRRLDGDLQRSESSLLLGLRAGTEASRGVRDALGISDGDNLYNRKEGRAGWEDDSLVSSQSTPIPAALSSRKKAGLEEASLSASLMTDMAIDPNEPKYCYCDQVSSGDMVACDNEDCPREWFHYQCVGLTAPPKGRWYCLFCAPPGYKGSGTFPPDAPCLPPGYGGKGDSNGNASVQQAKRGYHKKKK